MNNQDTFNIICSFLNPKELIKFRFLSNVHNKWTNIYLTKAFKIINIEEYVCPKCANWLDYKEDISNYNEFNECYLTDLIKHERFQSIGRWMDNKHFDKNFKQGNIERSKLLCDDCEYEEDYSDNSFENFRYKGSREYNIVYFYNIYSWVVLYLIKDNKALWNEYRKPLSICYKEYTVYENSSEYSHNYFNVFNDEYEEDYNDEYNDYEYNYNNHYNDYDN